MGGSESQKELKEFIYNLLKDRRVIDSPMRHILAPTIAQFRYKKKWKEFQEVGGSNIYLHTRNLANKMEQLSGLKVVLAMRYTQPKLKDVLAKIADKDVCIVPLYPQNSFSTIGSFEDDLMSIPKGDTTITVVKPFYNHKKYNQLIANNILKTIEQPSDWHLIVSAHGLPVKLIEQGDPYQKQVEAQAELLKSLLPNLKSVEIAYQSRFGNKKWLQPYLSEHLEKYKGEKVVVYPISFVIDNLETDHELKIEYKEVANEIGIMDYRVVSCPNDGDVMAEILVGLVGEI